MLLQQDNRVIFQRGTLLKFIAVQYLKDNLPKRVKVLSAINFQYPRSSYIQNFPPSVINVSYNRLLRFLASFDDTQTTLNKKQETNHANKISIEPNPSRDRFISLRTVRNAVSRQSSIFPDNFEMGEIIRSSTNRAISSRR